MTGEHQAEDQTRIDDYAAALDAALSSGARLSETERAGIVAEARSHLHERAAQGRLDEGLAELGAPEVHAGRFSASM